MGDILSYIAWRGDLTFSERPLNDVDSLILAELAYLSLDGIVPGPESPDTIPLSKIYPAYVDAGKDDSYLPNDPRLLAEKASASERFGPVRFGRYLNWIDKGLQTQFCAVTCFLPDGGVFAAFRGTDNSLVGWREDFNFSFLEAAPAQVEAVRYLEDLLKAVPGPVVLGGHSKGGNLAVYAAAFCDRSFLDRIGPVYSFDGPGFNEWTIASPEYQAILPRVRLILPEGSLVGLILHNRGRRMIVRSEGRGGVRQHNPYFWQLERDQLDLTDALSPVSQMVEEALDQWIDALSPQERARFVNVVFDSLDSAGITTLSQIGTRRQESIRAILHAVRSLPPELRAGILDPLRKLAFTGRDVLWEEARRVLEESLQAEDRKD